MTNRIKTAIHLHTNYSFDSNRSVEDLVDRAECEGLDCVAITDHDTIDGALAARELGRVRVIVGEEVSTTDGHLIGLFLTRPVPPGLSPERTIDRIREQGGIVLAPHPFSTLCDGSLGSAFQRIAHRVDAIEIHNAQNPLPWQDRKAARVARNLGLPMYAGSDTHLRGRLAPAYQVMPDFSTPKQFLASLRKAERVTGRFGPFYIARMATRHYWDRVAPRRLPGFGQNHNPDATQAA